MAYRNHALEGKVPTVYKARRGADGAVMYITATYRNGRYTRPATAGERRESGYDSITGEFADLPMTHNAGVATNRARKIFGYAYTAPARENLGDGFERID